MTPSSAPDRVTTSLEEVETLKRRLADMELLLSLQEDAVAEQSSKLRRALARLERSEANFKALIEELPDAVFVRRNDSIEYVNPALVRMLGYGSPHDLVGRSAIETLAHPRDRDALAAYIRRSETEGAQRSIELNWIRRDGQSVYVHASRNDTTYDGEPATLVVARDIGERRRAELEQAKVQAALRVSEERYRLLFDGSPMPVCIFDSASLRFIEVNAAWVRTYGYSREEAASLTLLDVMSPEDVPALESSFRARSSEHYRGIHSHRTKSGAALRVQVAARPFDFRGTEARIAIWNDVTETLRLEEQLRQAQKMEAIGQLAGGISHDFNNLLAVILTGCDLLRMTLGTDHEAANDITDIQAAAQRAANLTRQLLAFSRKQKLAPKRISLNALITDLVKLLGRVIGEDIRLTLSLSENSGRIEADPSQLEQVIVNLVVNARDAMPGGGTIRIETETVTLAGNDARALGVEPGRFVALSVRDTGCGMDAATLAHIFEPFFTTKEVGKGTGLGLATTFGIVEQSGGAISVDSQPGRGSTFCVYFPVASSSHDSLLPVAQSDRKRTRGSETVLLVEDDALVRRAAVRVLSARGYEVVDAASASVALEVLREGRLPVRLLVTDLVMPDMDGLTLAAQVRSKHPDVRILFMSGYSDHAVLRGEGIAEGAQFVQKPFTAHQIADAVRLALDAGEHRR